MPRFCAVLTRELSPSTDYAPFLRLEIADTRDGWVCLTGRKS